MVTAATAVLRLPKISRNKAARIKQQRQNANVIISARTYASSVKKPEILSKTDSTVKGDTSRGIEMKTAAGIGGCFIMCLKK